MKNDKRERCPLCGKPLPITAEKILGYVYLNVFCKHCKTVSLICIGDEKHIAQ